MRLGDDMDTLERDISELASGSNFQRDQGDRRAFTKGDLAVRGPAISMDDKVRKTRLWEQLVLQSRARLPITYEKLVERIGGSDGLSEIRNALEQLMDDDASEGRPFLAAMAVKALRPGLPAPWFFRKAETIGLFVGDCAGVEAYAFHASEFHRAIRFHGQLPQIGQGPARALRPDLPPPHSRTRSTKC